MKHHTQELIQCGRQMRVRQSIRRASPLWNSLDQTTPAQARELIGHYLARDTQRLSEVGRIRRCFAQCEKHTGAGLVG